MEFAEASPLPAADSLYDDVYVLDAEVRGWYSVPSSEDGAAQEAGAGAPAAANDEIPKQLTDALAAGEDAGESAGRVA